MFLLSKILSKFTPKRNELHLTTTTLFKALIRYNSYGTTCSFPGLSSNGMATIALFLGNKIRFLAIACHYFLYKK